MQVRIDDIGASTKKYNQHIKSFPFCSVFDFWPLHSLPFLKGWGPYKELTTAEWQRAFDIFEKNKIKPIVAITACWVEKNGKLVAFPEKFSEQAQFLKKMFQQGKIEVANHGLTHCVVGSMRQSPSRSFAAELGRQAFAFLHRSKHLPRFFGSNRKFHREFWQWVPAETHKKHILASQKILEDFFEKPITIFAPPGNVWSYATYQALLKTNIKKVIANRYMQDSEEEMQDIDFIDDRDDFLVLHDKDLKEKGTQWLNTLLRNLKP